MTKKIKVLVVDDGGEASLVRRMFAANGYECVMDVYDADMVCFVGGSDVSPSLYGEAQHKTTHPNGDRDQFEQLVYGMALDFGLPMVGICRGGQFLHVMNGGTMFQDVDNHNGRTHRAYFPEETRVPYMINSYHHQAMRPNPDIDHKLLLVAGETRKRASMSALQPDETYKPYECVWYPINGTITDAEAIWYPETKCLCYQPHPEYTGPANQETHDLFFNFIDDYILGDLEFIEDKAASNG